MKPAIKVTFGLVFSEISGKYAKNSSSGSGHSEILLDSLQVSCIQIPQQRKFKVLLCIYVSFPRVEI